MEKFQNLSLDFSILKEPRGFMRIMQFVLSIFAFATLTSVKTSATIEVACTNISKPDDRNVEYGYPFRIHGTVGIEVPFCTNTNSEKDDVFYGNFSSAAEFFCFVGVMSFLCSLVLTMAYVGFNQFFRSNSLAAKIDFIGSAIWTLMWFISSTAWADNVSKLGLFMDPENLVTTLKDSGYCSPPVRCTAGRPGDHSTLVVSVLFGYLNMGVWGAGLWFLFKETEWHTGKSAEADQQQSFDQPYSSPGYQTPEYTTNPSIPTTPTGSYQPGPPTAYQTGPYQ